MAPYLGNRSLLCIPTDDNIKKLNIIKQRDTDSWRPYAPVCQIEEAKNYFTIYQHSKEMLFIADIIGGNFKTQDNTARLQTVTGSSNAYLWKVLEKTRQHGYPILINTSLNAKENPLSTPWTILKGKYNYTTEVDTDTLPTGRAYHTLMAHILQSLLY